MPNQLSSDSAIGMIFPGEPGNYVVRSGELSDWRTHDLDVFMTGVLSYDHGDQQHLTKFELKLTLEIVHRLGSSGVQVWSYQEPWTEAGGELLDLLLAIAGWVARMESTTGG